MQEIQIKTESSPNRCEICHQADYFDPIKNFCSRCSKVQKTIEAIDPKNQSAIRNLEAQPFAIKYAFHVYLIALCTVLPSIIYLIIIFNKDFIKTWYLTLIPLVYWIFISSLSINKIKKALQIIGDTIKNREDLYLIKPIINLNKMLAISLLVFFILYIGLLGFLFSSKILDRATGQIHFLIFILLMINFAMINKYYETKLKTFKVDSKDSKVAEIYEKWIKQWEGSNIRLSD